MPCSNTKILENHSIPLWSPRRPAAAPWINVVYLVYSPVPHVYCKSTTFPQSAADQTGGKHDTFVWLVSSSRLPSARPAPGADRKTRSCRTKRFKRVMHAQQENEGLKAKLQRRIQVWSWGGRREEDNGDAGGGWRQETSRSQMGICRGNKSSPAPLKLWRGWDENKRRCRTWLFAFGPEKMWRCETRPRLHICPDVHSNMLNRITFDLTWN